MLYKKWALNCLIFIMIAACSDAKKQTNESVQIQDARFSTSCKLDTERLKKFFEEKVSDDIYCLKENLDLFMRVVQTEKPGYLSQVQLKQFILDRKTEIDPKTQQIIDLVYDIVFLIYGGEHGQISSKNVSDLTNFLLDVNKHSINIYKHFNNEDKVVFKKHLIKRNEMKTSLVAITDLLKNLTVLEGVQRQISLVALLDQLEKIWPDKPWEKLSSLLPIKPLILGGSKNFLTTKEWYQMLTLASDLTLTVFDLYKIPKTVDVANPEFMLNLRQDILQVRKILTNIPWGKNQTILKMSDIANILDNYYEDIFDDPKTWSFQKYLKSLGKVKAILVETEGDFSGKDFSLIFDMLHEVFYQGEMIYRLWDINQESLMKEQKYNASDWRWGGLSLDQALKTKILRIVTSYKFYRGDRTAPFISHGFSRNPTGLFEFAVWEYVLNRVFKAYGCAPSPTTPTACLNDIMVAGGKATGLGFQGEYVASLTSLKRLLLDIEPLVVEWGLILPNYAKNTAENIALLASLFSYQSDGDSVVEVNEGAEFFILVFSAIDAGAEMHKQLSKVCRVSAKNRIEPKCYRKHFMEFFSKSGFNGTDYSNYFPGFFKFLNSSSSQEIEEFVVENERAAMVCPLDPLKDPNDTVPKSKGDLLTSFVTLMSIETTIIRFDDNKNNLLDPEEILQGFSIYRLAVEGIIQQRLAWLPLFDGFTADVIYRFLIAEERIPTAGDVLRLGQLKLDCKDCIARRKTIASILKNIKNNSKENLENPFNCESLKD